MRGQRGFLKKSLGLEEEKKRIVGIRRVLGLGRAIRVLDKPRLYSHREREKEKERIGWCCSLLAELCVLS